MAKFSKRPKTGKPRTQPCTGHVFSAILGRPMSAREFDTAKQLGLVE